MIREAVSSVNLDEFDAMMREGQLNLSDKRVNQEFTRRLRPTGEEGNYFVILSKFLEVERKAQEDGGKLVRSTVEKTSQQLIDEAAPNLGLVNARLLSSRAVATEFAFDPANLVVANSNNLRHKVRVQKGYEYDADVRVEFGNGVAGIRPRLPEWAQLDAQFMQENDGEPLLADRENGLALFMDLGEEAGGGRFFVAGRGYPGRHLGSGGGGWVGGDPSSRVWTPAVVVPVFRLEIGEL